MAINRSPEELLRETLHTYRMLERSTGVLIALSGGADSVALTHLLLPICRERTLPVAAFHLNHLLRGEEAERDERFVCELCAALSLPLTVERRNIASLAAEQGVSVELAAREERYRLLHSCASHFGLSQIATAHTASDNLETVLFHLARGTGADGLAGIPPVHGQIIRPLIAHTGEGLRSYLRERGLPFVEDSTNALPLYTRNRIRSEVIPPLLAECPRAEEAVTRMGALLRRDSACLDALAYELLQRAKEDRRLRRAALSTGSEAILSRTLRLFVEETLGVFLSYHHSEALLSLVQCGRTGDRLQLPGGVAALTHSALIVERAAVPPQDGESKTALRFNGSDALPSHSGKREDVALPNFSFSLPLHPGSTPLPGGTLTLRKGDEKLNNLFNHDLIDYATIKGNLVVRGRLPGDRVELPNGHSRPLKKLLIDRKIDRDLRRFLHVVCDDTGPIWTPLTGVCRRCRAKKGAQHTFALEFEGKL